MTSAPAGIVWETRELTDIASPIDGDLLPAGRRRQMRQRLDRIAADRAASERLAGTTPI